MSELGDDIEENHDRFIVEVLDTGKVWGLKNNDGWALCESETHEHTEVIPFWSAEELAREHCEGDWADYWPEAISLDGFIEEWLLGMHEDGLFVGTNWNAELEGLEFEPLDLIEELEEEMS